jgi:hypothetical protein
LLWLAATTTTERVIAHYVLGLLQYYDVRRAVEGKMHSSSLTERCSFDRTGSI